MWIKFSKITELSLMKKVRERISFNFKCLTGIKKSVDKLLDDNSIILIDAESRIIAAEERSSKDRHKL